jgi:putative ABC transport system ATP-binding protein
MTAKTINQRPPLLEAFGIKKSFGSGSLTNIVLKGVDVALRPGELTLLMGPSGSGKTTLLSILGCLLSPSEGEMTIAGETTLGMGPEELADMRRRHIGFIFQSYNLFPTLTVRDNVLLAMDVRRAASEDPVELADNALIEVGLKHRILAHPSKLSGGEKQRVAIARALAGRPSVVLADEPTAALDSENGKAVMKLLKEVAQDPSRAVLAVTHDHRTLGYADRIIRIEDGYIVADERPGANGHVPAALAHAEEHAAAPVEIPVAKPAAAPAPVARPDVLPQIKPVAAQPAVNQPAIEIPSSGVRVRIKRYA